MVLDNRQLKQWATRISGIKQHDENFYYYKEAARQEVYRLAGVKEPAFILGMKYLLELPDGEFQNLRNGKYE